MAEARTTKQQLSRLNTLESVIVNAEDSAEDAHWHQAQIVANIVGAKAKQVDIAAGWINGRTREPYKPPHVSYCKQIWERWGSLFENNDPACPDWTTAYYTVQQNADELVPEDERRQQWSDAHEARAPKTERTAEKLVQNLLSSDRSVRETIRRGLNEARDRELVEGFAQTTSGRTREDVDAAQAERLPEPPSPDPWEEFWPAIRAGEECARRLDIVHERMHEDAWNQPPSTIRSIAENSTKVAELLRSKAMFLEGLADAASATTNT